MIEHRIKAATCQITSGSEKGTGWLIAKGLVITARHCVLPRIEETEPTNLLFPCNANPIKAEILAASEEWDICLLSIKDELECKPLPWKLKKPTEGEDWETFSYPQSKSALGQRLAGTVAQVLDTPKLKIDIDLSVDPKVQMSHYNGASGAAVFCNTGVVGIIRLKVDRSIAAISLHQLESFLKENGISSLNIPNDETAPLLADREDFPEEFTKTVESLSGNYIFLQGAHGYGKSTFCQHFHADENTLINIGAYCLSDTQSKLGVNYQVQPQVFSDWLSTNISELLTGKAPLVEEKSYPKLIEQTTDYLNGLSEYCLSSSRKGMLFIDGLNEVQGEAQLNDLLGLLPSSLPDNLTIVLTAPNFSTLEVALAGKVKKAHVFDIPPLSYSACYDHCLETLEFEPSSAHINLVCDKAKGHPLYLRYLIEYSNSHPTDENLTDFPELSGPIEDYYQIIWAKLLTDPHVINVLGLMARLRWSLPLNDFVNALNVGELAQFTSTINRIHHLLENKESTTIYHKSFATFIIENTSEINESAYKRLAQFCIDRPELSYCLLNKVFHLEIAQNKDLYAECNQEWVDTAVTLGVDPDTIIYDLNMVVNKAAREAPVSEFFRLLLLAQRISFRYDNLFAQSACLVAEALIALGKPVEALKHITRYNTLIIDLEEALQISYLLHKHEFDDESLTLLDLIQKRILSSYQIPITFPDFIELCCWHINTIFQIRLSGGWNGMDQSLTVLKRAKRACDDMSKEQGQPLQEFLIPVYAENPSYFLTFKDVYANIDNLKKHTEAQGLPEIKVTPSYIQQLCITLLNHESTTDRLYLPKHRKSFSNLFADLMKVVPSIGDEIANANIVSGALIRMGASSELVRLFQEKQREKSLPTIQITADNGVDVDFKSLEKCLCEWRNTYFLDPKFDGLISETDETSELDFIKQIVSALYRIDGKSRRALADKDESALANYLKNLKEEVITPLSFTLKQRASWDNTYAIPENLLPSIYAQIAELVTDCYPEELSNWLDLLIENTNEQWGLYSEGFRASCFSVIKELTRNDPKESLNSSLLKLLHTLKNHVLEGVENRHELVPDILKMIPIFANLGAKEEAQRLYQRLLSISMGPTWYKEGQLGLMTETLASIGTETDVSPRLSFVAGYLERASGEMTFQRYIRAEKHSLIGQLARYGRHTEALTYFRRQCCGSMAELWSDTQQGSIDKLGELEGNRYPGGAIIDQAAVLALVKNSKTVAWPLRWALLEIFHCGDQRYLTEYAENFADIVNEMGATPELINRSNIVALADTPIDKHSSFASSFQRKLDPDLHSHFASIFQDLPPLEMDAPEPIAPKNAERAKEDDDGFLLKGVFGRRSALNEASELVLDIEKQWELGNFSTAKSQAQSALQIAQRGGWGIWDNLSDATRRAKEIIVINETNAIDILRQYAPLIEAEDFTHKWIIIQHLISQLGSVLNNEESQLLLDIIIEHVHLLVGEASNEIESFGFLSEKDVNGGSENIEYFRFIVWLCDHPKWIRRERAGAMLLWLLDQIPELYSEAISIAFSMNSGYGADLLCGALDCASERDPIGLWDKIENILDFTATTQELKHVSRMAILERLATRANKSGSSSAKLVVKLIQESQPKSSIYGDREELPIWAKSLGSQCVKLGKLINNKVLVAWEHELKIICGPLTIPQAYKLEICVLKSFREKRNSLNRWESKLRYSLNLALWPFVSNNKAKEVEDILRSYNPNAPEKTLIAKSNPTAEKLRIAIKTKDYRPFLNASDTVILNYHDMVSTDSTEKGRDVSFTEILCLLHPNINQPGFMIPPPEKSFKSSSSPMDSTVKTPFETCHHLEPEIVFFGTYTPAFPLRFFQDFAKADISNFIRDNWRYGRKNKLSNLGMPEECGCSLSISRNDLTIPPNCKLTWLIKVNGKLIDWVDEHNNHLI